jgi:hypothetical protein
MEKETLHLTEPIDFRDFVSQINFSDDNEIVAETDIGQWKEQIVPTLYFRQNDYYRVDFNSASSGYLLKLISTEKNVSFSMEFLDTIFLDYYNMVDNKFSVLKCINRSDLTRFENKGDVNFMGVKAKNSYKLMKGMRGAPVGGLITGLIFRGAFKLAAQAEDDLVEKDGVLFSLYFLQDGKERTLDIVVESFYVDQFQDFLGLNWTSITPSKPEAKEDEKKEGCFIATACYNDYDHPIVRQLRNFRDCFLDQKEWGRKFISFYYRHSPRYARLIENNNLRKYFVKIFLIMPLYMVTKFFNLKNKIVDF